MSEIPESIKEKIYQQVEADLRPARWSVHAKIGGSVALGGMASLFLCGQLGLGLSPLAMSTHQALMRVGGFFGCTVVCAVVFALTPVVMLRALTSGIQFHVLISREWRAVAGWTLAFGSVLAFQNDRSDPLWIILLWVVVAIVSFEVLGRGLRKLLGGMT